MSEDNEKCFYKALEEIQIIQKYQQDYYNSTGKQKDIALDAIVFRLIQLSESLELVSEMFQNAHPEIPWRKIKGFRNRLVHDYGGVDLEFVESTLKINIPVLKEQLSKYIEE